MQIARAWRENICIKVQIVWATVVMSIANVSSKPNLLLAWQHLGANWMHEPMRFNSRNSCSVRGEFADNKVITTNFQGCVVLKIKRIAE